LTEFISIAAIIVFLAQLIFVINFFYSIFKGRKVTVEREEGGYTYGNPWEGTTLEWTAPIERLHGNWPGEIPSVHRWPYDYSTNGKNYISQDTPLAPGEVEHS
jgi:cytochrome c oxidase subunit 1